MQVGLQKLEKGKETGSPLVSLKGNRALLIPDRTYVRVLTYSTKVIALG